MATGLLALLDDVTSVLDDVALLTRAAAQKTAGVVGDDLALNANQVSGAAPDRELGVVGAVAKGSLLNKLILVPAALALSALAPWAITPALMIGGAFLCYEGVEKLWHSASGAPETGDAAAAAADPVAFERAKIRGAIRTDFILSAEIIVIALGTMREAALLERTLALIVVGLGMTVIVYGSVAGLVKLDDVGLRLLKGPRHRTTVRRIGVWLLRSVPWIMRGLSVAGTAAMFLVGGGILAHGVPVVGHALDDWTARTGPLATPLRLAADGLLGIAVGAALVSVASLVSRRRAVPA